MVFVDFIFCLFLLWHRIQNIKAMKTKKLILMLCLFLSGILCYAKGEDKTEKENGNDEIPISVIERSTHGGSEKGDAILPSIDGHYLTIVFTENLGHVAIAITTPAGATVESISITTPNGCIYYIADTGDYVVTFTLENGDEYYGEFTVTD